MNNKTVILDVREEIRNGREPFSKIMGTVWKLRSDQSFLLIAPFEPVPLFAVLKKRGFAHESRQIGNGDWEVLFTRNGKSLGKTENLPQAQGSRENTPVKEVQFIYVDARGLEPPQPMIKILEALSDLSEDTEIRAHTDRRPMHLYTQLEARGFTSQSEEQSDGSFITHIRRN